jgi:hypothetical protein
LPESTADTAQPGLEEIHQRTLANLDCLPRILASAEQCIAHLDRIAHALVVIASPPVQSEGLTNSREQIEVGHG